MSEDLNFHGNELVHFQIMYNLGAVLGQLPFALLFPKIRMNILVPALDILWGVFTLLQYRSQSYSEIMAYRFLVGLFEVSTLQRYMLEINTDRDTHRVHFFLPFTTFSARGTAAMRSVGEAVSSMLA
jgi:hypothetical protein